MAKYITISTSGDPGNAHINIDLILYVETNSSTEGTIYLQDGTKKITVTGTNLTSGFGENVNKALVLAAQTSWTNVVFPVDLEDDMTVTALTIG